MTRPLHARRPAVAHLVAACASAFALAAPAASAAPTVTEFDIPTADAQPTDIATAPDGTLWFVEQVGGKIGKVTPGNPPTIEEFTPPDQPGNPGVPVTGLQHIIAGPDGSMWFTATNVVGEVPTGDPTGGTAYGGLGLADPRGLAVGPDGNIWIVDGDDIKRVDTAGVLVPTTVDLGALCNARNIAKGSDNNMWVTCFGGKNVVRVEGDASGAQPFPVGADATPWDITAGPDGKLWFTGQKNDVGSITTAGSHSPFVSKGVDPTGITVGPDGALWYAEFQAGAIGRVTTAGVTSQITGLTANSGPRYITPGPDKTLWFTEQNANQIGRITGIAVAPAKPPKASFAVQKFPIVVGPKRRFKFSFTAGKGLTGNAAFVSVNKLTVGDRKQKVTFGKRQFTVPPGGKVTLTIRLSKEKFRLLEKKEKIRTRARVTLRNAKGLTSQARREFALKAPPPETGSGR